MNFLVVLTVVLAYKSWPGRRLLRDKIPFAAYQNWFLSRSLAPNAQYLLCVGLPVVLVFGLGVMLASGIWHILWLLLALVVLGYSIGSNNLIQRVANQTKWLHGLSRAEPMTQVIVAQNRYIARTTYGVFQSIYPVLFWFLLMGPAGALAYGLSRTYLKNLECDDPQRQLVETVMYWMEWLPARLTGFIFALLGNFGRCFEAWIAGLFDTGQSQSHLLRSLLGLAIAEADYQSVQTLPEFVALAEHDMQSSRDLLERTLFGWLGLAAILAIIGW